MGKKGLGYQLVKSLWDSWFTAPKPSRTSRPSVTRRSGGNAADAWSAVARGEEAIKRAEADVERSEAAYQRELRTREKVYRERMKALTERSEAAVQKRSRSREKAHREYIEAVKTFFRSEHSSLDQKREVWAQYLASIVDAKSIPVSDAIEAARAAGLEDSAMELGFDRIPES